MSPFLARCRTTARLAALLAALPLVMSAGGNLQAAPKHQSPALHVPAGGEPLRVARSADVPRQLRSAIDRAKCQLLDSILAKTPVVIFQPSPEHRVMAVVPCNALVTYSLAFVFERATEAEPKLVMFPIVAASGGFSATDSPGLMTWDPAAKTLTAVAGSDYCTARETRHTYRHGQGDLNGFVLVKAEHRKQLCESEAPWTLVWEAQPWPKLE
jgi:hypothetical protein